MRGRALREGAREGRHDRIRSVRRRRYSRLGVDSDVVASESHRVDSSDLQRHVQLHPFGDGVEERPLRRRAQGGATTRLCGSEPDPRRRRFRLDAEACDPRAAGFWRQSRLADDSARRGRRRRRDRRDLCARVGTQDPTPCDRRTRGKRTRSQSRSYLGA